MRQTKPLVSMLSAMAAVVVLGAGCASGANPEPDERVPSPTGPVNRASVGAVDRLPGAATALTATAPLDDVGDPPVAAGVVDPPVVADVVAAPNGAAGRSARSRP